MNDSTRPLRVVGLLSGTSVDGIDVAAADLEVEGHTLVLRPLGHLDLPYPADLRAGLLAALPPNPCDAGTLTRLDTQVGQAFADAAATGIARLGEGRADLVASLGQTIFHWVESGTARGTLQLGQPAWIAERTGLPVVADLRVRDIAAGGHGAPLASTLDALWLRGLARERGAPVAGLNIGGIANITVVPPDGSDDTVLAYDTGPGNALLDLAAAEVTGGAQHSDVDGALASRGTVHDGLLKHLLAEEYYAAAPPKSTGKELFHAGYLRAALDAFPGLDSADVLATLTELTATTIADACARHGVTEVVASGGGLSNPALVRALRARLTVTASDEEGLPADGKEAYLSAVLGWLTWHGVPANVPEATGARGPRLLGSITPGTAGVSAPAVPPVFDQLRVAKPAATR